MAGHGRARRGGRGTSRSLLPTPSRLFGPGTTRTSSPVRSRDLRDVRPQAVVAAAKTERLCTLAQPDVCADGFDLFPRDAHDRTATQPGRKTSDQACAAAPRSRPAEDRDHLQPLARTAFERELVDVAAAATVGVEQLAIDE